jgi:enoyl-CoA hydratase/carnithine racemase
LRTSLSLAGCHAGPERCWSLGQVAAQLAAAPTHLRALVKTRIQEGSSQALEDCTEHEIQNVMASVVHPHFRERLGQFRDKTMRAAL